MSKIQLPNIEEARKRYEEYAKVYFYNMKHLYDEASIEKGMLLKLQHGLAMSELVPEITQLSSLFNESYLDSAALDGLLHDIGRFPQYLLTKSLKDSDLEQYGYVDHGRLGEHLLADGIFVRDFHLEDYNSILRPVVGNHTQIYIPEYNRDLSKLPSEFQNESFDEVIEKEELRNWLIAAKIKLVTEADSFQLIQNIVNRDWVPTISEEKNDRITDAVWKLFINNQPIIMSDLKKQENGWTCNSGFALRNGLLPQKAQLRGTLEALLKNDYLNLVYQRAIEGQNNPDPRIKECYLYTELLVKNMIQVSDPIIKPEQREEAVQLTKKMWGLK